MEGKKIIDCLAESVNNPQSPVHDRFSEDCLSLSVQNYFPQIREESAQHIFYISDLHLDHKIAKRFKKKPSLQQLCDYIQSIVGNLRLTYRDVLLVAGDVSYNFEVNRIFYTFLSESNLGVNIYAVLGNHELWGISLDIPDECDHRQFIIERYREMLGDLGIHLLENELLVCGRYPTAVKILDGENLIAMSDEEKQDLVSKSSYMVLGGVGYAGNNSLFNASNGLYRDTITNHEDEIILGQRFMLLYDTLRPFAYKCNIIVLTHMPIDDWCNSKPQDCFFHVFGHTHRNGRINDGERIAFFDAQVGYEGKDFTPNYFSFRKGADIFRFLKDGIYQISKSQLSEFYSYRGIVSYPKREADIFMLKREGYYMFISKGSKRLSVMNGAQLIALTHDDIQYYYDRMVEHAIRVMDSYSKIRSELDKISEAVISIGGDGRIHGTIVDIDFFNHIYYNVYDGTITPYHAIDVVRKTVYKDVPSLLYQQNRHLYNNLIGESGSQSLSVLCKEGISKLDDGQHYFDTDIYSVSIKVSRYQYLRDMDIIRTWNDDVFADSKQIGNTETYVAQEIIPLFNVEEKTEYETIANFCATETVEFVDRYREAICEFKLSKIKRQSMNKREYFDTVYSDMEKLFLMKKMQIDSATRKKAVESAITTKHNKGE